MALKRVSGSIWSEWPFLAGVLFSILVFGVFGLSLALPVVVDGSETATKWQYLLHAAPNEIGDTLAGLAGSLAFVWLVVTVLLQAKELREQRNEFQRIAAAQDEQVKLLQIQGEIFLEEQQQRKRENEKSRVTSMISSLVTLAERIDEECRWELKTEDGTGTQYLEKPFNTSGSVKIRNCTASLKLWCESLLPNDEKKMTVSVAPDEQAFKEMRAGVRQLIELGADLGSDLEIRVENLRSRELLALIEQLLSTNMWHTNIGETFRYQPGAVSASSR